jgi:flagellar basal-body rod modification protein FlgD
MMAVDNVTVKSAVGVDGNSYTTAISNDKLTNDDFLKLLLEEMKMQDPTKPMDSAALMDSQLKMSTIESNMDMATAMKSLQASYATSALSSAANLVSKIVEDGTIDAKNVQKSFKVESVENTNGDLYLNVRQLTGYADTLYNTVDKSYVKYDANGFILDSKGAKTDIQIQMKDGRFVPSSTGGITLLDKDGKTITDATTVAKYVTDGAVVTYADATNKILASSVKKIW